MAGFFKLIDHEQNSKVPAGFAVIAQNNGGWLGTNNGYPLHGQPALYPLPQAEAITNALNLVFNCIGEARARELIPNPAGMPPAFWQGFNHVI